MFPDLAGKGKIKTLPVIGSVFISQGNQMARSMGIEESNRSFDLIGTEASGTSVHMAGSSIDNSLDPLHIGLPGTVGTSVGVGNLNTKGYALATKITLRHSLHLPSGQFVKLLRQLERLHIIAKIEEKSKSFFHFFLIIFRLIFFRSLV